MGQKEIDKIQEACMKSIGFAWSIGFAYDPDWRYGTFEVIKTEDADFEVVATKIKEDGQNNSVAKNSV